jgi:hypothetical protein
LCHREGQQAENPDRRQQRHRRSQCPHDQRNVAQSLRLLIHWQSHPVRNRVQAWPYLDCMGIPQQRSRIAISMQDEYLRIHRPVAERHISFHRLSIPDRVRAVILHDTHHRVFLFA